MTRSLLFVTGTRADFGKLEPLAKAAVAAGHRVTFFVTGMHLMARYGLTKLEVARTKGVGIVEFVNQRDGDPQDAVLAKTITGFSDYVTEAKPDLVVIHGDRVEALACALVCATNYIRCAHIEGGEVSGTIDEVFRHCNSKLAWCHFVSSDAAAKRVRALGEAGSAIHVIGSPELDFHGGPSGVTLDEVRVRYEIAFEDYGICTFHPVTSEQDSIGAQAQALFDVLANSAKCFVVILPNNDPGAEDIVKVIDALPSDRFRVLPSMRFAHFSELMKNARLIIGNSSAGVREAPFLGIPSIDVGTRQTNRGTAASIMSVCAQDTAALMDAVSRQWAANVAPDGGFGGGGAAAAFVRVLSDPDFWARGFQKEFQDMAPGDA